MQIDKRGILIKVPKGGADYFNSFSISEVSDNYKKTTARTINSAVNHYPTLMLLVLP